MPSNTPNLELYMKNPATDGSDYFDVETMMNDNWEKIDDFAGVMDGLKERLDTTSRTNITLQPGLQVIELAKTAPFSLEHLTGRMLVNLLGRYGGCEALGPWEGNIALITDATKRTSGMSSFRLTVGSVTATATITFNTRPGLYYVFAADVQVPAGVSVSLGVIGATSVSTTTAGSWQPLAHRFVATDFFHQLRLSFTGAAGSVCWMDSVRVYEITEADYNALATMTIPQRAAKYPYVDSVKPVRNPYAIRWTDANHTDIAAMLALQTDLYADPLTGTNADSVFERDGQYFKNKIWNRVLLDGSWTWALGGSPAGSKSVYTNMTAPYNPATWSPAGFRHDGKILDRAGGEISGNSGGTLVQIMVSNTDSGWGDSYTTALTTDEIKAYFLGWRMRDQVTTDPYNGGVKAWGSLMSGGTDYYTNTLPTTVAPDYKTPYELIYRLATPTVEPIVSEGQITLLEGSNQIEVGTGIVLRESAPIYGDPAVGVQINRIDMPLKNRVSKILMVYKDSQSDRAWKRDSSSAYGLERAYVLATDGVYNKSSAYSATYLMLDTSPISAFSGSLPDNEKSLLADLVQDVQQASTRLSVVENKKAEKDSPAWITPTLLNGFVGSDVAYRLMADYVELKGLITAPGTSVVADTIIFKLPSGYRALQTKRLSTTTFNTATDFATMAINTGTTGDIAVAYTGKKYTTLDGLRIPIS